MQVFFRNRTHILTRTQGKKLEDVFLIKIASKVTSLKSSGKIFAFIEALNRSFRNGAMMPLTAFSTLFGGKCIPVALPFFSLPKIVYISRGGGGGQLAQILGRYVPRQNQKADT